MNNRILASYLLIFIAGMAACAIAGNYTFIAAVMFAFVILIKIGRDKHPERLILLAAVFAAGMITFCAAAARSEKEIKTFSDKYVAVTGKVTEPPKQKDDNFVMTVAQKEISLYGKTYKCGGNIRVYCRGRINFRAGDIIRINGRYIKPMENRNKGGFNYKLYLKTDDIRATMFVGVNRIEFMEYKPDLKTAAFNIREKIKENIETRMGGNEGEFIKGLILGDKDGFTDNMNNNFADCGISHIVAVSGMHVSILVMGIMYLGGLIGIGRKSRSALSIFVILLYVFILGFVPSAIRAAIMSIAVMAATLTNRGDDFVTSLVSGAFIILLINPFSIFDTGFLLSFSAITGLYLFANPIEALLPDFIPVTVKTTFAASVAVNLMTLPVTATVLNKINIIGIFANIIILPFVSALFTGGLIVAILPFIGDIMAFAVKPLVKLILIMANGLARLEFINISIMTPSALMLILMAAIIGLAYIMLHRKGIKAALVMSALVAVSGIAVAFVQVCEYNLFRIEFINVGQGDSIFIRQKGENVLIDAGRENSLESVEYLKDRGVTTLDMLFITHSDSDHSGGAKQVGAGVEVEKVIFPHTKKYDPVIDELAEYFMKKGAEVYYTSASDSFNFGETEISVLMPQKENISEDYTNNNSIVLRVENSGKVFLLTGDAGGEAEKILVDNYDLAADVLKVGHHGSAHSTSDEFLAEIAPKYAIISCGENSYGHPSDEVLKKLEDSGCEIFRTDRDNNIVFKINKKGEIKAGE